MKKLITTILSLAMFASLSVTAFASTVDTSPVSLDIDNDSDASIGVYSSYEQERTDKYLVNITWGAMEFTYTAPDQEWNTETHTWENVTGGDTVTGWAVDDTDGDKITISNSSSLPVAVNLTIAKESAYSGINYTFSSSSFTLDKATAGVEGNDGSATTQDVTLSLSNELTDTTADKTHSATITVVLSTAE